MKNWLKKYIPSRKSIQDSCELSSLKPILKASCFWSYDLQPVARGVAAGLAGGVIKNPDSSVNTTPAARGAVHSAEREYAMGNLPNNRVYDWQPEDFRVSEILQGYFANFIKTGNPNGDELPTWSAINSISPAPVMHIDVNTRVEPEQHRERYLYLDKDGE